MDARPKNEANEGQKSGLLRWLPLLVIVALMSLAFAMGWHKYLSFKTIGLNYEALKTYIAGHTLLALLAYMLLYIVVVALSLPGGLVMTLAGGLLFGWQLGIPATVVAATIGATILFLAVKSSFGELLAAKAGPSLAALREGFQKNAFNYLLFLRLVPAFPFVVVNLAPALLGVKFQHLCARHVPRYHSGNGCVYDRRRRARQCHRGAERELSRLPRLGPGKS